MRILYQFPLSHFCEKARWLLDHKELDYVAQNLTPGLHRIKMLLHTNQHALPVLKDGEQWITDSTKIALYLDQNYPEHTLIRKEAELRDQILSIDAKTQELGNHVRRWLFFYILKQENSNTLDVILGEKGILRNWQKLSVPAMRLALKRMLNINEQSVGESKIRMDELIEEFNQTLIENGGRYLVGQRLTLADIAVCSMFAPLLMIEGTPWELDLSQHYESEVLQSRAQLMQLPLGQYIQRVYDTERNARIDWRGI
ncbi:glutathione S-transferase [Acinetobacter qingfengensis]|uniref:Glutathione S-transferase n=1 Tax=Acinetobacter qingfengensis TaxID=1262585 RepID=A0A1E7QYV7_9GAMM|nr:glutathione S-transferase family protein [Acinetobacter qingfengensis]KAA8730981.1 glutathione S-transferase [Acinetobacter qingfengensis]OEY92240.1 glutathione S-transferase [Acinetobacter qingfengensis]